MKSIAYDMARDIPAESTPQGFYWACDEDGVWEVIEIYHFTYQSGVTRVIVERCGWEGGWVGPITLGPKVEFPTE